MRRAFLTGVSLAALPLSVSVAQVVRWNDRAPGEWTAETPRVQLSLESGNTFSNTNVFAYGEAVRVRFRVDEDAYVVVGRVDSNGRLTILFPSSRTGRTFVRAGSETLAQGRRGGSYASFYAFDSFGSSYVFALASASPLDLSGFTSGDFERIGLDTKFTYANHRYANDPDDYVQRFASWALYDANTEYDYDVAFYSVAGANTYASSLDLCFAGNRLHYDHNDAFGFDNGYGWSLTSLCRGYYNNNLWCIGYSLLGSFAGCSIGYQPFIVQGPVDPIYPGQPPRPNKKGGGFGDDWKPEQVIAGQEGDWRTNGPKDRGAAATSAGLKSDGEWDNIRSIPARSLDELKRSERIKGSETGTVRTGRFNEDGSVARSHRETVERGGPAREAKAVARDRSDEAPRRFSGSSGNSRGNDSPAREGSRSGPVREGPSRNAGPPPRPVSREPSVRSEPTRSSEPRSSPTIRSEPSKGSDGGSSSSSGGGDRKKPPQN